MNKIFLNLIIFAIALVLAACGSEGTSGNAEESTNEDKSSKKEVDQITLSLADFFPASHEAGSKIAQGWADAVEEATDGVVKVEVYPGGTLLTEADIYEGVVTGIADVGTSAIGNNMGRFPVMSAMYLGGIPYKNSVVSSYVARDIIKEFNPEELQDTKVMFVYGLGPGDISSQKPIKTLEDLKGLEVRASGNQMKTFELLGASPIDMGMSEAYDALSKGVVEAISAPVEILEGWNIADVTEYITKVDFVYNAVHYFTMNKDTWESLPPDIQEKIEEVNQTMFEEVASSLFDEINESAMKYTEENFDHEIIELSDDEKAKWMEQLEPIQEEYIKELNDQGLPGEDIVNRIIELTEKYNNEF